MNDTTRDELVTEVSDEVEDAYHEGVQNGKGYVTFRLKDEQMEAINRSIEEYAQEFRDGIRAARDAEIREALLGEDVVGTMHSQLLYFGTTEQGVNLAVEYALGMIGLHGDGTEREFYSPKESE